MNLVNCLVTITSLLILSSCNFSAPNSTTDLSPSLNKQKPNPEIVNNVSKENISRDLLISEEGIGLAQLGIKLEELKEILGTSANFEVVSPFMVDLDAIAVSQSGEIQYYIVYPAYTKFNDSDKIELLLTTNPKYVTSEGVGVGMSLQEVANIYGAATISYNTQNESREMVSFANYNPSNIILTPTTPSQSFAGIYPSSSGEYHETTEFNDSATIQSIFVGF